MQLWPILALIAAHTAGVHAQGLRGLTATADAQMAEPASICGSRIPPPSSLPPASLGTVVYLIAPCIGGRQSQVGVNAYVADIALRPSQPSRGLWVPYDANSERIIMEDFQRLWRNHPLADLSVDIRDYRFSNGVIGKLVVYTMTERN